VRERKREEREREGEGERKRKRDGALLWNGYRVGNKLDCWSSHLRGTEKG
jgi:hypothetical protein